MADGSEYDFRGVSMESLGLENIMGMLQFPLYNIVYISRPPATNKMQLTMVPRTIPTTDSVLIPPEKHHRQSV